MQSRVAWLHPRLNCSEPAVHEYPLMADGGCSDGRIRRHFADIPSPDLSDRIGASISEIRPPPVGHQLPLTLANPVTAMRLIADIRAGEPSDGNAAKAAGHARAA